MRLWYLISWATSEGSGEPEPSLFAHMKYGSRRRYFGDLYYKPDIWTHWMAAHARLKNEFTEDEKCHNLKSWLDLGLLQQSPKQNAWPNGLCVSLTQV